MDKETEINELRKEVLKDLKKRKMRPSVNTDLNVVIEEGEFAGEHWRYTVLDRQEFVDGKGKRRISLCPDLNGGPFIPLCDKNGEVRMAFALDSTGKPSLEMRDQNGVTRLTIGLAPNGEPGIVFWNEKGKPCFTFSSDSLTLGEDGKSGFRVNNTNDLISLLMHSRNPKNGICLGVSKNREPAIGLTDSKGNARIGMTVHPDGTPDLSLLDRKGNAIWQPEIPAKKKPRKKVKAA